MSTTGMKDARVVIVGASSGIGRALAEAAGDAGARIVAAARRRDALESLTAARPVEADVCTAHGRAAIAEACRAEFGGLDLLIYAAGRADLRRLQDTDAASWRATLETNVEAFNLFVAEAIDLLEPPAIVAALSSDSTTHPRSALAAYTASKAALNASARGWQIEHPGLRFSVVEIGPTTPTGFGDGFDMDVLVPAMQDWQRRGLMPAEYMDTTEVAGTLVALYDAALQHPTVGIEHIVLRSPSDIM
jgi:NAD(P)-dependent dehydrogenase (short-subunit alcohol dehydrogenase family)